MTLNAMPRDLFWLFLRVGVLSFGGPAAQVDLMHRLLVEEKRVIDEAQFFAGLNFCMLLPGPEAMQLATYIGWRANGIAGGLVAGLLFVLPGAFVVGVLALLYALYADSWLLSQVFYGVKPVVLAIVFWALVRLSRKALKTPMHWVIAAASFAAIFLLSVPFPLIVLAAGLLGYVVLQNRAPSPKTEHELPTLGTTARNIAIGLAIWLIPIALAGTLIGPSILSDIGWLFSKLAVVTFGGAYAVLAYLAQTVVQDFGWLNAAEMLDGLGLAETTPGPLILVTEFVGFLAGYKQGGIMLALAAALITLWATFAPCFLWIFAGAPYITWLSTQPRLSSALAAITAAVVGVMLNLTLWFGLHVVFKEISTVTNGPLKLLSPHWSSLDIWSLLLALVAAVLLQRKLGIGWLLAIGALCGICLGFV